MPSKDFDKIFGDIFQGELPENKENLQRAISQEMEKVKEIAKSTVLEKQVDINRPQIGAANRPKTIQKPLTEEEATLVDEKIARLRSKLTSINKKIGFAEKSILQQQENDRDQPSFSFDISDKPRLRRFTKVVFGQKLDKITFSQYKQMLEEKQRLEKEDGNSMFEEEEDDKTSGDAKDFVSLLKRKK